ncbi:MAG: YebC/PmpR family DNA-binding transcriptional regulator [Ruminococcaceae bacterium]|nr:YebC/PmpR family DNA-binding transcriptional regulator [Oscillospiraceae bacterium]
MSGHSKWNNIKRKKEKTDTQRAKIFTKMGREIMVAVREGGPDPNNNGKLRDVIAKAKANNVPTDNIERIIKKAEGGDKADYETIIYEGYGPAGVAVIVESLTDNRNRTAADVRHYFDKYGGNLGTNGCVSFMFQQKGVIVIDMQGLNEDKVMEDGIECGAEDISFEDGVAEIYTSTADLRDVREAFENKKYSFISAEIEYVPDNYVKLEGEDNLKKMGTLLELLEDNDDIQGVWHNLENEEDLP